MGMRAFKRIKVNISDIGAFGLRFLWRHSLRVTGADTAVVSIPGFGCLHLRPNSSDVEVVRQIFGQRQYDVASQIAVRLLNRYNDILRSGRVPIIVDAGANIGAASLWFTRKYPDSIIVAIEPDYENFQVLKKNVAGEVRIRAINAAIGATRGFVCVEKAEGWASQTVRADEGVRVLSMKDCFDGVENGAPFFVKVDIEGFESDLFSKNSEWLAEVHAVFIEPHDWLFPGKFTSQTFQRAIAEYNFEIYINGENLIYVR
jgi:FkbM family methyltransferase